MDENYGGRLSFYFVYPPDEDIKGKKVRKSVKISVEKPRRGLAGKRKTGYDRHTTEIGCKFAQTVLLPPHL